MAFAYRDSFETLQRELEAMLESALGGGGSPSVYPPVNLFDAGQEFVARAELPGVDPGSVELTVEENRLVLRGQRRLDGAEKDGAYHRRERGEGEFRRVVRLPANVAQADVKAEYRDGVLTVRIPKAPETQPHRVAIQSA
jgi:HSP20 family protein